MIMLNGVFDTGSCTRSSTRWSTKACGSAATCGSTRRSLAHMVENNVDGDGRPLRHQSWERVLAVLDQGQLGSCTGNAGTGALGTQPFYDAVGKDVLPDADRRAAAREVRGPAVRGRHGGRRVSRRVPARGHRLVGARHLQGAQDARHDQGLPLGAQRLRLPAPAADRAGPAGHALVQRVLHPTARDSSTPTRTGRPAASPAATRSRPSASSWTRRTRSTASITYVNSWGTSWGDAGRFRMRLSTYEKLSGVDLKQYRV